MDDVVEALHSMPYPPELTTWVDQNRGFTDRVLEGTQQALDILQRLSYLRSGTDGFQEYISLLRNTIIKIEKSLAFLDESFTLYLSDVRDTPDESVQAQNDWEAGWQAGLQKAAELVQQTLKDHQDALLGSSYSFRTDICALSETLRQLAETRQGTSSPIRLNSNCRVIGFDLTSHRSK